jgi:uroporphyrin-3 C-methyltransferase
LAWLALLCSLLLAALLAAAAYWLWPQWQQLQQQVATQHSSQQQQQQQLQAQTQGLIEQAQQQQRQFLEQQQSSLRQLEQQLQSAQRQQDERTQAQLQAVRQLIQQRDGAPPAHWLLAETEFFLQRAGQQLMLQGDSRSAIILLQQADDKLATLDDPALLTVRQAIKQDLAQLKALPAPKVTELFLTLHQLRQQTGSLPFKQDQQQLKLEPVVAGDWRSTLKAYWQQSVSKLFQVRKAVPEDYFSLSEQQQWMVRIGLQQQLLLAELAVLQGQQAVFAQALQQAADTLQRYFVADNSQVQQLSSALVSLAAKQIAAPEYAPLQSLAQLQRYLQLREDSL